VIYTYDGLSIWDWDAILTNKHIGVNRSLFHMMMLAELSITVFTCSHLNCRHEIKPKRTE
jgi:hypothetical protein